jgi:epoxyqueuosine reductase
MNSSDSLSDRVRCRAVELGFDLVGIAPAARARHADAFFSWLDAGHAGEMSWLTRNRERRADPSLVLEGAASVVSVGMTYFAGDPPAAFWDDPSRGRIARYAWGRDYHDVLTPSLKSLSEFIRAEGGGDTVTRYYVDTGPVLERSFASQAGVGFIGKNTLLIHPGYGSYLFLAEILVNRELQYDEPATDDGATLHREDGAARVGTCGGCRRCLDICPTHAFPAPYILDSRLCISYLTIELRTSIPVPLRSRMSNWIFGCDACQSVCPWVRRNTGPAKENFLVFNPDSCAPRLTELMRLDDTGFRERFRGTPVTRAKRRGFLRNVAVALGNWGDAAAKPALEKAIRDPEPLIREHAQWALERIG